MSVSGPEFLDFTSLRAGIDFAVRFLRRRYLTIVICLLLSLAFGALYLFITPRNYTASALMMIETRRSPLQSLLGDAPPDGAAWIESQIGVLKSQIAEYVVKQLRLTEDPEFIRSNTGLLDNLLARLGWASERQSEAERVSAAIAALNDGLEVRRLSQSYIMQIDFRSHNREQAVKVAKAMIDGYIDAKYQANRSAGDWLQERLQALLDKAASAERAVIEFKAKNNIVAAGGTLMNEKQLSENSGQLAAVRSHASDVKARLERIEAVRRAYQQDQPASAVEITVTEAKSSQIITKLRTQYLDLVNREADWSVRYGKNHSAVVNLRNQIRDTRRSIRDELRQIEETYRSEFEIAKKRQDEAEKELAALVSQSTNQAQVTLISLEAAAQSYRKLYDSFLRQDTESVQQQSFPISEAHSLSPVSISKTDSRTLQVWMVTICAGGMLGVGFGVLRDIMDRGFRTREQVESVLETECLALVPRLSAVRSKSVFRDQQSIAVQSRSGETLRKAPERTRRASKMWETIVDSPSSPYSEAIRLIRLILDLGLNSEKTFSKVIGLTSCLPREGKSTIAAAMATLIAQSGARVILVDCDVRNPSLSRALAPDAEVGVLELIDGKVDLADAVLSDPTTSMAFLPTVANSHFPNSTEMLASDGAKLLFTALQNKYDYVIVDLAPLAARFDVRATSRLIDSYLFVIEWGSTKIDAVQYALRNAPGVQENIVGAVLNKVDMAVMGRYDSYGANDYYYVRGENARTTN
jgi:polysaccharide biosynthesis transport protein